jgi:hypothetical protein
MAHFAELDSNNIVLRVIVVDNKDTSIPDGTEVESIGVAHCQKLYGGTWKQTSYNATFRKNYAGVGFKYYADSNLFAAPQPYASWTLNTTSGGWDAPITEPTLTDAEKAAGKFYSWDESAYQADNSTGWVLITP